MGTNIQATAWLPLGTERTADARWQRDHLDLPAGRNTVQPTISPRRVSIKSRIQKLLLRKARAAYGIVIGLVLGAPVLFGMVLLGIVLAISMILDLWFDVLIQRLAQSVFGCRYRERQRRRCADTC